MAENPAAEKPITIGGSLLGGTYNTSQTSYNIVPETKVDVPISIPPPDLSQLAQAFQSAGASIGQAQTGSAEAVKTGLVEFGKYAVIAVIAFVILRVVLK